MLRRVFAGAILATAAVHVHAATGGDQRARVNYLLHCAGCHLPDGSGSPGAVPDLREYLGRFAQHPVSRPYLARVPGAAGAPIGDAELAAVLNWILLTMNGAQLRAGFVPYTPEEVAMYRRDILTDVEPVRRSLIQLLHEPGGQDR